MKIIQWLTICILYIGLIGCGFHLRGTIHVPPELQVLKIWPNDPFNRFQKTLRSTLQQNGVLIVDAPTEGVQCPATLSIISEQLIERVIAYGVDGQNNRIVLQLTVVYQITTASDQMLISPMTIQVEREMNVVPNAVLGTNREREKIISELYIDATSQMMRNLTPL